MGLAAAKPIQDGTYIWTRNDDERKEAASILMTDDILDRCYEMLSSAEGYFAAAAHREITNPPYKNGKAVRELRDIRSLLADLEKAKA